MFTPCRYLVHSILLFPYVLMKSWLIPKVSGRWGVFVFHLSVLGGCWTEQPSLECSLLPVQVPSLDFYKSFFKRGSGFAMVLSSRSKCIILTYGRDIWPCSSYLYNWYVEFMGRKMYAYLGYLYCPAEEWSMMGSVLSQIQVSWNMEYLEGMKEWSRRLSI